MEIMDFYVSLIIASLAFVISMMVAAIMKIPLSPTLGIEQVALFFMVSVATLGFLAFAKQITTEENKDTNCGKKVEEETK
jgi:hypothetical protein